MAQIRGIISERSWGEINAALALAKHSPAGAPPVLSDREFLAAVLWLARTGSPWRDLPAVFGQWYAVHPRFQRWRGVWPRLWQTLQREEFAAATKRFVDRTSVRVHPHAAGAPKKTVATKLLAALGAG
jgi:transposase